MLKGFLAGGLFAAFFILETILILKIILLVYALIVLIDDLFPSREDEDYPILSLICLILGFVVALLATPFAGIYTFLVFILATIMYVPTAVHRMRSQMVTRF